ncbi:flagellar biosynthesis regulator FlaF [Pseudomonas sp. GX19020]|uniref:flagellar biosynthesis regulator FlaF n=1 Tax=Pseudomonas sp. GX19020 TaxID=2942277 RepID=UPI002019CD3E|nr:flagellar biosynthesis regulator FlaF [Pseudomonas sp. GX19020]MCL4066222.1 flagellar biosynthesis regulator FlaF [Pseudomonas sp. GX19020]
MTLSSSLAYAQPTAPIRTPRMAEYEVIARITQRLVAADRRRNEDHSGFLEAVFHNEKLWSTLAADVAEPGNGLPEALRARLFYLYRFTADHSRKIRQKTADAGVLIEINKAVLKGLRGEGAAT